MNNDEELNIEVLRRVKYAIEHGACSECFSFAHSAKLIVAADRLVNTGELAFDYQSQTARWYKLPTT